MTRYRLSEIFTKALQKDLIGIDNIADVKVEVKEEHIYYDDSYFFEDLDTLQIQVRYYTETRRMGEMEELLFD